MRPRSQTFSCAAGEWRLSLWITPVELTVHPGKHTHTLRDYSGMASPVFLTQERTISPHNDVVCSVFQWHTQGAPRLELGAKGYSQESNVPYRFLLVWTILLAWMYAGLWSVYIHFISQLVLLRGCRFSDNLRFFSYFVILTMAQVRCSITSFKVRVSLSTGSSSPMPEPHPPGASRFACDSKLSAAISHTRPLSADVDWDGCGDGGCCCDTLAFDCRSKDTVPRLSCCQSSKAPCCPVGILSASKLPVPSTDVMWYHLLSSERPAQWLGRRRRRKKRKRDVLNSNPPVRILEHMQRVARRYSNQFVFFHVAG